MKAKTFENLIRKVVREEIDYALRREIKSLKEDLRDDLSPRIVEQVESTTNSENNNPSLREKIMGKKPLKKTKPQSYTNNSMLNDLLNETAQGDTNLEGAGISPVSLSESFTQNSSEPMDTTGMPESVANAVTRDYSDLMKAIDKKKGN